MKYIFFFIIMISFSFAQTAKIVKIINTNVFELEDSQRIKLYGLIIPTANDVNKISATFSSEILRWENSILLDREFKIEYVTKDLEGTSEVKLYKVYALAEENIANRFLSSGYAALNKNVDKNYYDELLQYQEKAKYNYAGIWKPIETEQTNIDDLSNSLNENYQKSHNYERPYLPLLAVSLASFALAWDSFVSASDLQNSIDAFKKLNVDTAKLESAKTRKSVVGVTCILAGVVTTLFAFESVEVKANFNSLSLNYKF